MAKKTEIKPEEEHPMSSAPSSTKTQNLEPNTYNLKLKVVATIPCYNTQKTVGDVVTRAKKYVDEVLVIDDGSKDNTVSVAEAAGAIVIKHEKNQGYGAAIKSCFAAAKSQNADILVIVDGDGQHSADEIPQLIAPISTNKADLVIGSRFVKKKQKMPRYRKFGIWVITFLWNFGSNIKVTDTQSGFRAYKKQVFENLEFDENGMSMSIEILEKVRRKHTIIREVPISCSYEENNAHLNFKAFRHGILVALAVIKIRLKAK